MNHFNFTENCTPIGNKCCCRGEAGPRGPQGAQGIPGPTGPTGDQVLAGIQYQLVDGPLDALPTGDPVIFNTLIENTSPDITYNSLNGQFSLNAPGLYYVSWSVSASGAGPSTFISLGIEIIGGATIENSTNLPISILTGTALVNVTTTAVIQLINTTGEDLFVENPPIQANITILHLTSP